MFGTQLYELGEDWVLAIVNKIFVGGYVGRPTGDGTYEYEVSGDPSQVYFRLGTPESTTVKTAFNFGVAPDPRLRVYALRFAGTYVILFPDPSLARELYGESAAVASQPLYYHTEKAASIAVPAAYMYLYENFR